MSHLAHKYQYRRHLPHFTAARPLFVTFCKQTNDPFSSWARSVVLEHCLYDNGRRVELHAAVVMPGHVHLLFTPLHDAEKWTFSLPHIMKGLKGASAHKINRGEETKGTIWQEEFFDHVLRSDETFNSQD